MLKTAAMDTARVARSTFQAMGFSAGHWYMCERGHPYVVADCSMFNGTGRCPDCNAVVGHGSSNSRIGDESAVLGNLSSNIVVEPPPDLSGDRRREQRKRRRDPERDGERGRRQRVENYYSHRI